MRLTTKIIIGIILSIFLLCLLPIIGYSFSDRKNYNRSSYAPTIQLPQTELTGILIETSRVIVFEKVLDQSNTDNYNVWLSNNNNDLFIKPPTSEEDKDKLFVSSELREFITYRKNNDTLFFQINLDAIALKYDKQEEVLDKNNKKFRYGVSFSGLNLYLHTANVNVINMISAFRTQIKNLETDSIKIYSTGEIVIDSCKAHVIEPESKQKLLVTKCTAKTINIDLDIVTNWRVKDCDIDVRNYSGSKNNHSFEITPPETGTIYWLPKNKDAALSIKFKSDTTRINFSFL